MIVKLSHQAHMGDNGHINLTRTQNIFVRTY